MNNYKEYLNSKQRQMGVPEKFDNSALDPRFIPAFESGERIRVKGYGEVMTGTVGVTTGWKPVFILMRNKRAIGSSVVLDSNVEFTTEKKGAK